MDAGESAKSLNRPGMTRLLVLVDSGAASDKARSEARTVHCYIVKMPAIGEDVWPQTAYLGSLLLVPYYQVPRGWSACKGQILPMGPNMALYALLGNTFGGDGKTTFALPNLTGAKASTDANGHALIWFMSTVEANWTMPYDDHGSLDRPVGAPQLHPGT